MHERQAVTNGQHDVHHRSGIGLAQQPPEGRLAVQRPVDGVAGLLEALHHERRDLLVVLDDQQAHGGIPSLRSGGVPSRRP
jgi:hypothetical protein